MLADNVVMESGDSLANGLPKAYPLESIVNFYREKEQLVRKILSFRPLVRGLIKYILQGKLAEEKSKFVAYFAGYKLFVKNYMKNDMVMIEDAAVYKFLIALNKKAVTKIYYLLYLHNTILFRQKKRKCFALAKRLKDHFDQRYQFLCREEKKIKKHRIPYYAFHRSKFGFVSH